MIVNYGEEGWEVITQRSHGIVAAQIGFEWKLQDRPQRWLETLLAIAEHDDAENELDGETLITPAGGPLNFAMRRFELPHCRKLSELTITKSRYIALLTSMHMYFLYGREEKISPEAKNFLDEEKRKQSVWRKELNISLEESTRIYNLLEWCDAISLLICKGDLQPEGRSVEISSGPDNKSYHLLKIDSNTLKVEPWPFQSRNFEVRYDTRLVKQVSFNSSASFRKAFLEAPVTEKSWSLVAGTKKRLPAKTKKKLEK